VEVDVNETAYQAGHLEGAVPWNVYADLLQPSYRIIDRNAFAALLRRSGVLPGSRVVVCGYAAAMAFWVLAYYGHQRVWLLNGSRDKWVQDGRPTFPPSLRRPTPWPISSHRGPASAPPIRSSSRQSATRIGSR
jgi:thiosulfate/3-mercaptopyruvate sulfurtransferase